MIYEAFRTKRILSIALLASALVAAGCGGATEDSGSADSYEDKAWADEPAAETPAPDSEEEAEEADEAPEQPAGDDLAFLSRNDTRAMWLWSESPPVEAILDNAGGAQDELFAFLKAPHGQAKRNINRLYFESRGYSNEGRFERARAVDYDPLTDPAEQKKLRAFIKRANAQGTAVEYLDGQAIWVATDQLAENPKQLCRDVVAFNKGTDDPTERFAGLHLDIEPHTVRNGPYAGIWWENRLPGGYNGEWTERWKDILNSCRATLDAYAAETGHQLTLASDLGGDYAHYNKPILEFLNRANGPLDYITLMNYYDNRPNEEGDPSYFYGKSEGEEIVGGVIENLSYWTNLPVMFAMETGPESIAQDWQSFYQEGHNAMYKVIDELYADYASGNMLGVGIHHYGPGSYRELKP